MKNINIYRLGITEHKYCLTSLCQQRVLKRSFSNNLVGNSHNFKNVEKEDQYKLIPAHMKNVVKDKIKIKDLKKDQRNNISLKKIKSGFKGYELCLSIRGLRFNSIGGMRDIILKNVGGVFKSLDKDKVYSLLVNVHNKKNDSYSAVLPYSLHIYKGTDLLILTNLLIKYLVVYFQRYNVIDNVDLNFLIREWYTNKDIELLNNLNISHGSNVVLNNKEKKFKSLINIVESDLINKNMEMDEKIKLNKDKFIINKLNYLRRKSIVFRLNPYIINKLNIINCGFNYTLYSLDKFSYFFIDKCEIGNTNVSYEFNLLEIYNSYEVATQKEYFIIQNKINKYKFDITKITSDIIYTWIDYIDYNENNITRYYLNNKIVFDLLSLTIKGRKSFIKNIDLSYGFPKYLEMKKDYLRDQNIGVIDFETLTINSSGDQVVYSGGWAVKDFVYIDYLANNDLSYNHITEVHNSITLDMCKHVNKGLDEGRDSNLDSFNLSSYNLIKKLFDSIFESNFCNYTFYMHNLGGFDYIFILSALSFYDDYKLKPVIKEDGNILVSLKISRLVYTKFEIKNEDNEVIKTVIKKVRKSITILDSYLILPGSLRNLAIDFECDVLKGIFPYTFMNKYNLNYKGPVPDYKYFESLDYNDYILLKKKLNNVYDIKKESIKYLKNDLLSLLELVNKFSIIIYQKYKVNITKSKTISSLALYVYLSSFYKYSYNIKVIKGNIEKEIRQAYFGGLVLTKSFHKYTSKGYVYDSNSHYPNAMLEDMPVGNPVLSTSKNLYDYFGFVYAEIVPPKDLDIYFIPMRDSLGNIVTPNYIFNGLYFSELLKESEKYGYIINVKWGYKFERGKNIFKNYVKTIYEDRLKAKLESNKSLQIIDKSLLTSLYGKFGMNEILNKLGIFTEEEAEKIMKNKNVLRYTKLHNKVLLRYNNNINKEILDYIEFTDDSNTFMDKIKQRGVTSSVPIAAAVTSWGLIKLLKFFNMDNNKLIYSDTDSVFLEKPLNDEFLSSNELGKMKTEFIFDEAIFISPKFYGLKNENNTIIKSKGVGKGLITYEKLEQLYLGNDLTVNTTVFRKKLDNGTVAITTNPYTIKGKRDK